MGSDGSGGGDRELADRMGVHYPRVNELVDGKCGVTAETAVMLARVLGTRPELWLNLQQPRDLYETLNDPASSEKLKQVRPLESDG